MGVRADSLLPISRLYLVSKGNRAGSKFPPEFKLIARRVAFCWMGPIYPNVGNENFKLPPLIDLLVSTLYRQ
jgi:hypothetical protein